MKKIISTPLAPQAIGPYSQAILNDEHTTPGGGLVFCSGQIALDPKTLQLSGETAAEQTEQVMKNLEAVLKAAGSDLSKVLKTTVYLKNIDDFAAVNETYGKFFSENPPARATVEVSRLPKGALVEIDCIAHL